MLQPSLHSASKWIIRNTLISNESLTPEFKFHLITIASPLWMSTPDECPLPDPYWAFYWPGGQGLSRFILDNKQLFCGSQILDFGAGCGSASMAASVSGASRILANDIDKCGISHQKSRF
uniref:ETFB lysine methyltransferase n=1 Tax=Caenorhabditis tropicalis TaxID=1561998 RepID=A0A1I7T850_9PELO